MKTIESMVKMMTELCKVPNQRSSKLKIVPMQKCSVKDMSTRVNPIKTVYVLLVQPRPQAATICMTDE